MISFASDDSKTFNHGGHRESQRDSSETPCPVWLTALLDLNHARGGGGFDFGCAGGYVLREFVD